MNYKMIWHRMNYDLGNDPKNAYISIDFTDNANILYYANISFADAEFILNNIDLVYNNGKDNRKNGSNVAANGNIYIENKYGPVFTICKSIIAPSHSMDHEGAIKNDLINDKAMMIEFIPASDIHIYIYITLEQYQHFRDDLNALVYGDDVSREYND